MRTGRPPPGNHPSPPQRPKSTVGTGGDVAAPPQARSPWDSPSVWVHLPDSHAPTSAPTPNPGNLAPDSQGSPPPRPAQALHPGHRSRVQRTRQGIGASCSPGQEGSRAPRPDARGRVSGSGAARTSAGCGRGRPERDCLPSARWARLEAGGARRGWRPQDQKSDSGSGQMSCCLSTARAAAQHSPL